MSRQRPLDGVTVIDVSASAPGKFATMILADFGAVVTRVRRPGVEDAAALDRGTSLIEADLKQPGDRESVLELCGSADVFVEGFRPGTMERLGLGPDVILARNQRLIYTRVTAWGQDGPYSGQAGHDINCIAIGGPLGVIGADSPVAPANFVADFGGGSLMAVIGILLALRARETSGVGQVVDAAMVDGATLLLSGQLEAAALGDWGPRGTNIMDGAAPFYGTYRCADGEWFAVGAVEPKFYAALLGVLGITDEPRELQDDKSRWPRLRARMSAVFAQRTRAEWTAAFDGIDACASPVLNLADLPLDPHIQFRGSLLPSLNGLWAAAPAPRLSGTPGSAGCVPDHSRLRRRTT